MKHIMTSSSVLKWRNYVRNCLHFLCKITDKTAGQHIGKGERVTYLFTYNEIRTRGHIRKVLK